jgi:2'-phosphotransferase
MASLAPPYDTLLLKSKARKLAKKNRKEKKQGGTHDVKLSKMLSRLLRHRPQGLVMQPDGYVKVSKLLQLDGFKRYEVADIVCVVEANDKQRFSLIHAGKNMMVRANQGHTIKTVDQEQLLTRINDCSEVPCCIHGTYFTSWELIKTSGLDKMARNHVHCAIGSPEEESVISGMRASCEVVIHIDVRRAMEEGGLVFYRSLNNVILTEGPVLPKYFLKCVRRSDNVNLMLIGDQNNKSVSGVSKDAAPARVLLFDDSWMDEIGVHPKDGFGTYKDDDMVLEKERVEKEEKEVSGVSGGETKIGQQQQRQVGMGKNR